MDLIEEYSSAKHFFVRGNNSYFFNKNTFNTNL